MVVESPQCYVSLADDYVPDAPKILIPQVLFEDLKNRNLKRVPLCYKSGGKRMYFRLTRESSQRGARRR
jgi:hypothetical protein